MTLTSGRITAGYMISLSDDQIIQRSTTDKFTGELASIIKTEIRNSNSPVEFDKFEVILNRVDTNIKIVVANGICAVKVNKGGYSLSDMSNL